ncbi:hypothetical protein V1517DRAFT_333107 [Lipomyces orientalis]|uniref:Uncharacterized protein n=1 Tax=Lipomyces orientalis TaxID=1233043 RepID=A0ACC3TEG5_9ASCO
MPVFAMMERIRGQMMLARARRLKEIKKLQDDGKRISEYAARELTISIALAREYIVIPANLDEYDVRKMRNESFPIHLDVRTSTCQRWTYRGVHCAQGIAAIAGLDIIDFVDDHFKIEAF